MIARIWHGWAKPDHADRYEQLLTREIMPQIAARKIPGFLNYEILRRDLDSEVEFTTILRFDSESAIEGFVGPDRTRANLPDAARAVLDRWDEHAVHLKLVEQVEVG